VMRLAAFAEVAAAGGNGGDHAMRVDAVDFEAIPRAQQAGVVLEQDPGEEGRHFFGAVCKQPVTGGCARQPEKQSDRAITNSNERSRREKGGGISGVAKAGRAARRSS
jgi:hypothetical protein